MNCLECGGDVLTVDSRPQRDQTIRRRKKCVKCGVRFTTFEGRCDEPIAMLARQKKVLVIDDARYNALVKASQVITELAHAARPHKESSEPQSEDSSG